MFTPFDRIHKRDGQPDRRTPHDGIDSNYAKHCTTKTTISQHTPYGDIFHISYNCTHVNCTSVTLLTWLCCFLQTIEVCRVLWVAIQQLTIDQCSLVLVSFQQQCCWVDTAKKISEPARPVKSSPYNISERWHGNILYHLVINSLDNHANTAAWWRTEIFCCLSYNPTTVLNDIV